MEEWDELEFRQNAFKEEMKKDNKKLIAGRRATSKNRLGIQTEER